MNKVPSITSMLILNPNIGIMPGGRGGGISFGSAFFQTFIAISSGIIYNHDLIIKVIKA